jgi:hypothetical protein
LGHAVIAFSHTPAKYILTICNLPLILCYKYIRNIALEA